MCLTNHYISRNCGHHWLAIRQPCWPGYGFTYCPVFGDGVARDPSPVFEFLGLCPACATPGFYNQNLVRMITHIRDRCRWGFGPSRYDPGVECAVILNRTEHGRISATNINPNLDHHVPTFTEYLDWHESQTEKLKSQYRRRRKKKTLAQKALLFGLGALDHGHHDTTASEMLPTPDTSHVAYERVYEPAEDSFLLLDVLSSPAETAFLRARFGAAAPPPFVVEIGPGSGVVVAFLTAHAASIFGTREVLTGAVDVNAHACAATAETVRRAVSAAASYSPPATPGGGSAAFLGAVQGDLAAPLRDRSVDVLVFNPPYVPTAELPSRGAYHHNHGGDSDGRREDPDPFAEDSYLLALSYAGGRDGMETTDRLLLGDDGLPRVLSARGCAYVLLCAQNRPEAVKGRLRAAGWAAETVGSSGRTAGWEKLQIVRIWRDSSSVTE
ncbi:hypothetical protein F4802DRAFT_601904 [Xylaria palmicola]|nr:hypothetical protein F4802DRAFT_601904 [Xylaria palmicola]